MSHTLGPYGKATVILFTAQFDSELPKLAEMKRLLKIPDGKYYRSHGHHFQNRVGTDVFITVPDVQADLFMTLKYSAHIVAAYNLTNEAVSELGKLLRNRGQVCRMRFECRSWPKTLDDRAKQIRDGGLSDPSVTDIDISSLSRMFEFYGDAALKQANEALSYWHNRYRG